MKPLYKTTIIVWSDDNTEDMDIDHICQEAVDGAFYCSKQVCEKVEDPEEDPEYDCGEFFNREGTVFDDEENNDEDV
jgi:hypothetical protein